MKQSLRKCCMGEFGGCIDPCHECPNMEAVKFRECEPDQKILEYQKDKMSPESLAELKEMLRTEAIPETLCPHEQGSKECYKVVCPVCKQFKPKGTRMEQNKLRECLEKTFG